LTIEAATLLESIAITGFCDTDWASDPDDRRSTFGEAKKQTLVARSSAEAENRSLAQAAAEIL